MEILLPICAGVATSLLVVSHMITFVTAEPPGRGAVAANVVSSTASLMQAAGGGLAAV